MNIQQGAAAKALQVVLNGGTEKPVRAQGTDYERIAKANALARASTSSARAGDMLHEIDEMIAMAQKAMGPISDEERANLQSNFDSGMDRMMEIAETASYEGQKLFSAPEETDVRVSGEMKTGEDHLDPLQDIHQEIIARLRENFHAEGPLEAPETMPELSLPELAETEPAAAEEPAGFGTQFAELLEKAKSDPRHLAEAMEHCARPRCRWAAPTRPPRHLNT